MTDKLFKRMTNDDIKAVLESKDEKDWLVIELKIGELIKNRGITQSKLSEMTGIRQAALSQLARGNVERIYIEHLQKIANALDVKDINELITLSLNSEVTGLGYDAEERRIQDAITDKDEEKDAD